LESPINDKERIQEGPVKNQERLQVTLVSHTHWDRAWYVPYQEFRIRLVRLVDRLLELLHTHPDFGVFMLDGQTSVLEDYLNVRPQRAAELQALCRSGRILVGPWYILADEFLSSPEALIRNLMWGHRMGLAYGGVMKAGYVPDGFGHIAQLPQILSGFGIQSAFFWRGVGAEGDRLGTEFEWEALDGSSVTAILMPYGYHNVSNLGFVNHWGDTSQMVFDPDLAQAQIRQALDKLAPFAHTPARLLMNGIDHAEPEPRLPEIIRRSNQELEDAHLTQGTLLDHLRRVQASEMKLPHFCGEFRWGRYSEVLQGVYSTRIYLKQANQRVETLLERYVEPLSSLGWLGGACMPDGTEDLIWLAWRTLIQSHAHDDLYGSGVDQTHRETLFRIEQAGQISETLLRGAVRALAGQIDCSGQPGLPLLVFNPLGQPRREIAIGEIELDFDDPAASGMEVVDSAGRPVPHQVLEDLGEQTWMEVFKANRKRKLRLAFQVEVPACGYQVYFARPAPLAVRPYSAPTQEGAFTASNAYHRLVIAQDGSLEIEDLQSGEHFRGLNTFEDVEDAGDEYSYASCPHTQTIRSAGRPAKIKQVQGGPCITTFRVEHSLPIPIGLDPDRQQRRAETVDISIVSEVSLFRDQPGIFITTSVDNRACDHKLSVVFPTHSNPAAAMVDESFAILPRPIDLPIAPGWVEDPTPLMHQRAFIDLSQDGRGLAVLNRGLPSVEVKRGEGGVQITLPLLRAIGWLSRSDLLTRRVTAGPIVETPEAQCLGRHRFEYAILPHSGDWQAVYPLAYAYTGSVLIARADTHEGLNLAEMNIPGDDPTQVVAVPWQREGPLPAMLSFLALEPRELVLSAVRRSADGLGLVVRAWNAGPQPVTGRLTCCKPLSEAWLTNLNEERHAPLEIIEEHDLVLPFRKGQVVTIELKF
jgi:mannosylglycerate hydrolase